jgi:hypothetical protein
MSKKKRIKKLVKGHLASKNAAGVDIYAAGTVRKARLAVLDDITQTSAVQLLEALTGTTGGDADGVAFAADAFPFDAAEQKDTDGDGIGDNRDIILNKIALDVILKAKDHTNTALDPNTGTMKALAVRLANADTDLTAAAALGTPELRTERLAALRAGTHAGQDVLAADCTKAALATILASVNIQKAEANALKVEIDAATATAGVTILDGTGDYNGAGASAIAVIGAAAVDADALATAAASSKGDCDTAIDAIE